MSKQFIDSQELKSKWRLNGTAHSQLKNQTHTHTHTRNEPDPFQDREQYVASQEEEKTSLPFY